jgi:hypothetical protein
MFPLCAHASFPILGGTASATPSLSNENEAFMSALESRNPTTGKLHDTYPETPEASVDARLEGAHQAYREALLHKPDDLIAARSRMLRHAAAILESRVDEFASVMTREMGKTLVSAKAEVLKCAKCCRYYADHGHTILKPEVAKLSGGGPAEIRHEPLGVILAVMPWNFPFWQVIRCAAPILLSGNSYVLKHASNVPESALAIESVFHEAFRREKLDPAAFATFLLPSSRIEKLIGDRRCRGRKPEKVRPRTRRKRPFYRLSDGEPREGRHDRRRIADAFEWSVLYRGETLPHSRITLRKIPGRISNDAEPIQNGRPDDAGHSARSARG